MVQVKLNKSNDNPFYGMRKNLLLFQNIGGTITETMLEGAYKEARKMKDEGEAIEMFFSLFFAIGDITNRQHNIFKNTKRDNGGNSNREGFYTAINWLMKKNYKLFVKFLEAGLFNEYSSFDMLFRCRVQTKGTRVVKVYNMLSNKTYTKDLLNYVYRIVNGNSDYAKLLVAKFLTIPRMSKRSKHNKMLPETKVVMESKAEFLLQLSKLCGWEYETKGNYVNFKGYRKWRQKYNKELESVIFSTKAIEDFGKDRFLTWFDTLPAQARFRVKNRILYSKTADEKPKYPKLQEWYKVWEKFKEEKQAEQRILEEKVRQNQATEADKVKLEKVKKQAKVTVGATSFNDIYKDVLMGNVDELRVESFINKVNLPYNSLVIIDDSGSMSGAPFNFAMFLAAVCLVKNPDDDGRNLIGMFDTSTRLYSFIDKQANDTPNSILRKKATHIKKKPLVDPKLSFMENYRNIASFLSANFQWGGTNISSIADNFAQIAKANPEVLDALKAYPIWTIISDGEWNNMYSPESSLNDFLRKCENFLGFKPFIVAIDIDKYSSYSNYYESRYDRFSGIDNFMYIPSNPAMIEQFLTNFKDMDVFDVYTPLQSIYRSNRYDIVRAVIDLG